jgi:hypothetical protein
MRRPYPRVPGRRGPAAMLPAGVMCTVLLLLAGCDRNPLRVTRSACPAVAIPFNTGQITRFSPVSSRDASAIDVTASITGLSGACVEDPARLVTDVRFTVVGQRRNATGARDVYLPLFLTVVQGGNVLVSKQLTGVTLKFAAGQLRAEAATGGRAQVARSVTLLPADIQAQITRVRKPDDPDALVDPLANPQVRAAVRAVSFEVLVGFQLDDDALAYNVGK